MAKSARNLNHHLQRHGRQWRVRVEIPAPLRPHFGGRRFLVQSLGEVTEKQARVLRGPVLSAFEAQIAQARNPDDPLLKELRTLRRSLEIALTEREEIAAMNAAEAVIGGIEEREGEDAANDAYAVVVGFSTPFDEYLEDWLTAETFPEKTAIQHRKAFRVLGDWCKSRRIPSTLKGINARVAWEFRDKHLRTSGLADKTINRYLSAYRTHWNWLVPRMIVESNPWLGTHVKERRRSAWVDGEEDATEKGKTAFTDEQITALLKGNAPEPLPDLMRIAALTGARINVICNLRVRDCKDGRVLFKRAKKEKYDRLVHIHSGMKSIIESRSKNKAPDAFIFDELPAATPTRPRSAAVSQAFTRYRRRVGVGAGEGEKSKHDFHSFRRWFITKAEQAGHRENIVAAVIGHNRPGITFGIYSDGPSVRQMKRCVESVKLPNV